MTDGKEVKNAKDYDPNVNSAGYAHVPIGQKVEQVTQKDEGRMVTNPPYQTPELGDAPDEMKTEADKIYRELRSTTYHDESTSDRAAASGTMWTILKKSWKKNAEGKWIKKVKS